jgi:hypothetical protein
VLKKFSFTYVKQHPIMFGSILLVFGLLFWLLLNRSASAGQSDSVGGTTVITPGPSDAQIAAGVALQQTQVAANRDIAIAQLSLAAHGDDNSTSKDLAAMALSQSMAQIQADYNLGKSQIEASVGALAMQLSNNLAITNSNNSFMLDYAKNAQDAATTQLLIGANLQAELGAQSLEGYKYSAALSVIPTLKKSNRDNALAIIATGATGADAVALMPKGGGGFSLGSIANFVSPVTNLI